MHRLPSYFLFFFFNDTATTEIYTLSLHDALPIYTVCVPPEKLSVVPEVMLNCPACVPLAARLMVPLITLTCPPLLLLIGKAHVWTPVTDQFRMPSFA